MNKRSAARQAVQNGRVRPWRARRIWPAFIMGAFFSAFSTFTVASVAAEQLPNGDEVKKPERAGLPVDGGVADNAAMCQTPPAGLGLKVIFGGSLCPACLVAFERRLKDTDGISFAKVEKLPEKTHTGHPPKRASAVVFYDPAKLGREEIIRFVRQNDFQFLKATEVGPGPSSDDTSHVMPQDKGSRITSPH